MNEAQERAVRHFEAARRQVQASLVGKPGARAEILYGEAYQEMVVAGVAPQIKLNYRQPKPYRS